MSEDKKARNAGIDALKGIACIGVVFGHCEFPGVAGIYVQALIRWTVPLFFVVSGYFYREETVPYALSKAKHIFKITAWATLFYVVFECLYHLACGDLIVYMAEEFTVVNLAAFVVFNSPIFVNGHLWFLFSLLYVYLAYAFMIRLHLTKYEKQIGIVLMVCFFVLSYGLYFSGHPIRTGFYRNFLFEGLPFFLFGKSLRQSDLLKLPAANIKKTCIISICAGCFLSIVERYLVGRDFSIHISSLVILTAGFVLAAKGGFDNAPKSLVALGQDYSLMIYIIHPAVYLTMDLLLSALSDNIVYLWIRPIATVLISIALAKLFLTFKNKIIRNFES